MNRKQADGFCNTVCCLQHCPSWLALFRDITLQKKRHEGDFWGFHLLEYIPVDFVVERWVLERGTSSEGMVLPINIHIPKNYPHLNKILQEDA